MIAQAYEAGVNFFDNAEVYAAGESEKIMGEAFKRLGFSRDSYIVSSKVFWGGKKPTQRGLHKKHVVDACNAALQRLQVDYLDLYFCHRPDIDTPIEETVWMMNDLQRQGKILYWGTSEWSAEQIREAHQFAAQNSLQGPSMEQPEYNMFHRERVEQEYAPLYKGPGLGTTIWSPLASGILTGKYKDGAPKDSRANVPGFEWIKDRIQSEEGQAKIRKAVKLEELAKKRGISLAQMSLLWCLRNPEHVSTVILGASKPEQLKENLSALDMKDRVDAELWSEVEKILDNTPEAPKRW